MTNTDGSKDQPECAEVLYFDALVKELKDVFLKADENRRAYINNAIRSLRGGCVFRETKAPKILDQSSFDYMEAKRIRESLPLSRPQLRAEIDVSEMLLYQYETGRSNPLGRRSTNGSKYIAWLRKNGFGAKETKSPHGSK